MEESVLMIFYENNFLFLEFMIFKMENQKFWFKVNLWLIILSYLNQLLIIKYKIKFKTII